MEDSMSDIISEICAALFFIGLIFSLIYICCRVGRKTQNGYYYKAKNNCFIVIQNNYNNDLEEKKREVLLERALSIYNELTFPAKQEA